MCIRRRESALGSKVVKYFGTKFESYNVKYFGTEFVEARAAVVKPHRLTGPLGIQTT
jgi:hypothetical protein